MHRRPGGGEDCLGLEDRTEIMLEENGRRVKDELKHERRSEKYSIILAEHVL